MAKNSAFRASKRVTERLVMNVKSRLPIVEEFASFRELQPQAAIFSRPTT